MTDRPIIFSAPMILALLEGRKTQTRRLAWRGSDGGILTMMPINSPHHERSIVSGHPTPWQRVKPGDRLWVRESVARVHPEDPKSMLATYAADGGEYPFATIRSFPSIHMPRRASRLTLVVTATKIERVHEISENDAKAEGAEMLYGAAFDSTNAPTNRRRFELLWRHLHGDGAWDANPEVVPLTFTVARANIDRLAA